jgi:hypothetical protein
VFSALTKWLAALEPTDTNAKPLFSVSCLDISPRKFRSSLENGNQYGRCCVVLFAGLHLEQIQNSATLSLPIVLFLSLEQIKLPLPSNYPTQQWLSLSSLQCSGHIQRIVSRWIFKYIVDRWLFWKKTPRGSWLGRNRFSSWQLAELEALPQKRANVPAL